MAHQKNCSISSPQPLTSFKRPVSQTCNNNYIWPTKPFIASLTGPYIHFTQSMAHRFQFKLNPFAPTQIRSQKKMAPLRGQSFEIRSTYGKGAEKYRLKRYPHAYQQTPSQNLYCPINEVLNNPTQFSAGIPLHRVPPFRNNVMLRNDY